MASAVMAILRKSKRRAEAEELEMDSQRSLQRQGSFFSRRLNRKGGSETRLTQVTPVNLNQNEGGEIPLGEPSAGEIDFKALIIEDPDGIVGLTVQQVTSKGNLELDAEVQALHEGKFTLKFSDGTIDDSVNLFRGRWAIITKENLWQQNYVFDAYNSNVIQVGVAALIFANFIVSAIEKQALPAEDSSAKSVFLVFEWFFGMIFLVELIWNMYGSWWFKFWRDAWNWFDFIIVLISLLSLTLGNLPGISVLRYRYVAVYGTKFWTYSNWICRLFRAFRVFRLFKRVPSLKVSLLFHCMVVCFSFIKLCS